MKTSARRHLHLRPRSRAVAASRAVLILALPLVLPGSTAAARAEAVRAKPEAPCPNAQLQPLPVNLAQINTATLCMINKVRAASNLHKLRFSSPLQSVAVGQARDMVLGDYFGDMSLSGRTPLQRILATGYPGHAWRCSTAQNIGWATGPLATPAEMVQAWMRSPPHRKIMLTPGYRDVGVGVAPVAPSSLAQGLAGATYTIEFGVRIFSARGAGH
jgi:uncharacterized protein YkwD